MAVIKLCGDPQYSLLCVDLKIDGLHNGKGGELATDTLHSLLKLYPKNN